MTELSARPAAPMSLGRFLFPAAILLSAGLVFLVQPLMGRLLLPQLGGSPAVWNTSMAFFQAMLLLGYAYAHALQRIRSTRVQVAVHMGALALAALFLPIGLSDRLGSPDPDAPILWLLGVLGLSIGAPFAVLSATAPLIQAWYARASAAGRVTGDPYVLYAASNLGSLVGLLAYPVLVEPNVTLGDQRLWWSLGFGAFAALMLLTGLQVRRAPALASAQPAGERSTVTWLERLRWLLLAAIPSSLLLGVTAHLTTDVAPAPFLWAAPLALYLLTFVIAFQAKPLIGRDTALIMQAAFVLTALLGAYVLRQSLFLAIQLHLVAFFFSALVCHQALAARRPPPDRLTEFYLLLSLGGVLGGAFNAFLAPAIFNHYWEYPLALLLSLLARPWGRGWPKWWELAAGVIGVAAAGGALWQARTAPTTLGLVLAGVAILAVIGGGRRALLVALICVAPAALFQADRQDALLQERNFLGVKKVTRIGEQNGLNAFMHGTTLHGAQYLEPARRCQATTYYAQSTPIGQTYLHVQARLPRARFGVTGLGVGSVASYVRGGDTMRFFEIDPLVPKIARDRRYFTFLSDCAKGPVDITLGDARVTLARQPDGAFDHLLMDAFSSDSVPTHLLTVEAMRLYLAKLAPEGMLAIHVSNRHLELAGPVAASIRAAGGLALVQDRRSTQTTYESASATVVVALKSPAAAQALERDGRWSEVKTEARPWTDDYVNLFGALIEKKF